MPKMYKDRSQDFLKTLKESEINFLYGVINLNMHGLELDWDLDAVLAKSEIPVFDYCDKDLGTNFSSRKLDGYGCISKWLVQEGHFKTQEEAEAYEESLWDDPKILSAAVPNSSLQKFSQVASERNIPQSITTSRPAEFGELTKAWVKLHFPWIEPSRINVRPNNDIRGDVFKAQIVSEASKRNPNLVHLEDAMHHVKAILSKNPTVGIVGFCYPSDNLSEFAGKDRVFLPGIETFENLLYY